MKKYFRFSAAILIAAALLLTDSVLGQALFTPSGGTSTGAAGTLGIGIDADPALAPLDIVGNNVLIRPSNNFNPNGKFIGLGESGGVLGPINGCDLYGFRAQRNQNTNFIGEAFINVGIRQIPLAEPGFDFNGNNFPTVSWGGFTEVVPGKPFLNNLDFLNDNSDDNCGDIVARMSPMNSPYQFTVFGDALVTGTLFQNSDVRYKQNIQPIGNAMDLIAQLQGSTYTMNQEAFPEMNFKDGTQYGFIAQHVEEVIPEMVQANGEGFLSVNYTAMVPLLVEGLKEQQDVVEGQKEVIEAQSQELEVQGQELAAAKLANAAMNSQLQEQQAVLEQQDALIQQILQELEGMRNGNTPAANGNAASFGETSQLFQNRPNPFRESTEIHFYLPTDVAQATLVIYSLDGKELMSFNNLDRGYGNVLVKANELQPGNYVYRLIADNEVVDSKTLVLSK